MANHLFISYHLTPPGRGDGDVARAIQGLGHALRLHESLWLVDSSYSAGDAAEQVRAAMTADDCLIVVDSSNDRIAWFDLGDAAIRSLRAIWNAAARPAEDPKELAE
jgi:hypothetical protein